MQHHVLNKLIIISTFSFFFDSMFAHVCVECGTWHLYGVERSVYATMLCGAWAPPCQCNDKKMMDVRSVNLLSTHRLTKGMEVYAWMRSRKVLINSERNQFFGASTRPWKRVERSALSPNQRWRWSINWVKKQFTIFPFGPSEKEPIMTELELNIGNNKIMIVIIEFIGYCDLPG
jgi:hypothetical protein